jgi:hypothetical protein
VFAALETHLGSQQVSRVIYGAILGLALTLGLERHPPGAGVVVATLFATAIAVGLAEIYSEVVGTETRTRTRIDRASLREIAADSAFVAFGITFPSVFFLLAAAGAVEIGTAFEMAKWSGLGLIGFYGFCAARLAGEPTWRALLYATAIALVGAFLIALKALLH